MLLQDRVIVVIGGTTGLGLSGALACARAGGRVVVVGRDESSVAEARRALGDGGAAMVGEAMEAETAGRAIALAVERFGAVHGVYHVAGGSGRRMGDGPLHEISDAGWRETLDLNLTSLFHTNRAAARHFMAAGGRGSVLNVGSVLGMSPAPSFFATHAYAAAKAGVIGLTRSCAAYYAPHNIRFNVIAPGLVDTPMAQRAAGDAAIRQFIQRKQPLDAGRIGRPSDLDAAVVYFLSDASAFTTGQVLHVDGGWSVV